MFKPSFDNFMEVAQQLGFQMDFINYDAEECRTDAVAKSADEVCTRSLIFFLERELHSSTLLKI